MKNLVIAAIKFCRNLLFFNKLPSCRFYPSCSAYAIEAIHKKGVLKGLFMSFLRIFRCNPISKGGYDPVK
ncbi:MAG: membrane protein insertion efficiency factor YidD [Candidatus Omnitrophota bacterium]